MRGVQVLAVTTAKILGLGSFALFPASSMDWNKVEWNGIDNYEVDVHIIICLIDLLSFLYNLLFVRAAMKIAWNT